MEGRGERSYVKRKIVFGDVKHTCYFSAKTSLKFVPSKKLNSCFILPRVSYSLTLPYPRDVKFKISEYSVYMLDPNYKSSNRFVSR
jgi:hypothetical protein